MLNFSYEPQELRDFILCQISQHQVTGVQALAKVMGWQVLASSCFLGSGAVEPFGSAAGCLLANSKGEKEKLGTFFLMALPTKKQHPKCYGKHF